MAKRPSPKNEYKHLDKLQAFIEEEELVIEEAEAEAFIAEIDELEEAPNGRQPVFKEDSVQLYLKSIGKIPLLTPNDEITLAKEIAAGDEARAKTAANRLIQANLKLVVSIAKHYSSKNIPLLDLIQEGNTGLMRATQKFNHELGYRFSTYATWWIKQAIIKSISEKERSIKIPAHVLDQISRLKKTVTFLTKEFGRAPSDTEVAALIDFHMEDVKMWQELGGDSVSLESPSGKEVDSTNKDLISDSEDKNPETQYQQKALKSDLLKSLDSLDPEEKQIIELRFGFNTGEHYYSLEEVCLQTGWTREKIRALEFKALRRLKYLMGDQIKDYLTIH